MNTKVIPFMKKQSDEQDGYLQNFSISGFLQVVCMEKNSCTLSIINRATSERALLHIKNGILIDAEYQDLTGSEAAISILYWENVNIHLIKLDPTKVRLIKEGVNLLLFESARLCDELKRKKALKAKTVKKETSSTVLSLPKRKASIQPIPLKPTTTQNPVQTKAKKRKLEHDVDKVQSILDTFKSINGFTAVGIFSPEGEMIQEACTPGHDLASIGAIANEMLVKAQASTEMLGFGRGNLVHINAPKAHIFVSCLNESSGFQDNEFGKAHIHMVLVIDEGGNQPMAKMKLKKGIAALAPLFR